MRTCRTVEERQANLSDKLARATSLLRSWIDVQLERQNSDLLASMNNRAKLQLRLQQTVEGLSVAAISYYVIGLLAYLIWSGRMGCGNKLQWKQHVMQEARRFGGAMANYSAGI